MAWKQIILEIIFKRKRFLPLLYCMVWTICSFLSRELVKVGMYKKIAVFEYNLYLYLNVRLKWSRLLSRRWVFSCFPLTLLVKGQRMKWNSEMLLKQAWAMRHSLKQNSSGKKSGMKLLSWHIFTCDEARGLRIRHYTQQTSRYHHRSDATLQCAATSVASSLLVLVRIHSTCQSIALFSMQKGRILPPISSQPWLCLFSVTAYWRSFLAQMNHLFSEAS